MTKIQLKHVSTPIRKLILYLPVILAFRLKIHTCINTFWLKFKHNNLTLQQTHTSCVCIGEGMNVLQQTKV